MAPTIKKTISLALFFIVIGYVVATDVDISQKAVSYRKMAV
jgi:hypothetical protein